MADYLLDPGEIVIERIKRYWVDLVPVFVSGGLIVIVVLVGIYAYFRFQVDVPSLITPPIVFGLAFVMLAVVVLMILSALYVYSHNYLVVTNKHVIKVQQTGLFSRQTSELKFGNIEDVKGGRHGVVGTILDYGDVEVQTAGASENFFFHTVHHPQLLADRLLQKQEDFNHPHVPVVDPAAPASAPPPTGPMPPTPPQQ